MTKLEKERLIKDCLFNLLLNRMMPSLCFVLKRRHMTFLQALQIYKDIQNNQPDQVKKRSNTLAVMGSGPSINELTEVDLEFLQHVDTFGFNYWAYHDLVPDFYMVELPASEERFQELLNLLWQREEQYRDTIFFFKYANAFIRRHSFAEDFVRLPPSIQKRTRLWREKRLRYSSINQFNPNNYLRNFNGDFTLPQPQAKGSAVAILNMALTMGYENVILYGIDLTSGYFWENEAPPDNNYHRTGITTQLEIGYQVLIPLLREQVFLPQGCEIFVASKSSRLFPNVPVWKNQRVVKEASAIFY